VTVLTEWFRVKGTNPLPVISFMGDKLRIGTSTMNTHARFTVCLLAIGVLATLSMDLTALTAIQCGIFDLGRYQMGPSLLGRWIGSMAKGQLIHSDILKSATIPHEIGLGIFAHYVIGFTLSSLFVIQHLNLAVHAIRLRYALAFGIATCILPWFLMFPALGFGAIGLKTSRPHMLALFSTFTHVSFGAWIFVWGNLFLKRLRTSAPTERNSGVPEQQRKFWSIVAHKYDAVVDLQIGPMTRSLVLKRVAKEACLGHLAEFGCGTGYYTQVLASRAETIVATDVSPGMLALARQRVRSENVIFREEDCQQPTFSDGTLDTAFLSLVLHFTDSRRTLREMHRILKVGGLLVISNLDLDALKGFDRIRCSARVLYYGLTRYRQKPPRGFGKKLLTERQLRDLLGETGFLVLGVETIANPSRSSNIPVEYFRAVKI
jgi:ABC-2 type transport system ATP-binding protein